MADPATIAMIAKAAIAVGSNKKVWTGIASVVMAILLPFILVVVCIMGIASGGAANNQAAVNAVFHEGGFGTNMPDDYREYIKQMQESFGEIDTVLEPMNEMIEGDALDDYLLKSVFYSLYFGKANLKLGSDYYAEFVDCFVNYEERARTVTNDAGEEEQEVYTVAIAMKDMTEIYGRLQNDINLSITSEDQSNAISVYYYAKYQSVAPMEGDVFDDWTNWSPVDDSVTYDLPYDAIGGSVLELAKSRLGHSYSQDLRGQGDYVDCSYLTMWCYRKVGVTIPGTAAEQARYCVENHLTIAKENLQPGDLVFWSHKPNGRFMDVTHTGVYAGGGMVVDASFSKGKVVYRNLFDTNKQVLYGRPYAK